MPEYIFKYHWRQRRQEQKCVALEIGALTLWSLSRLNGQGQSRICSHGSSLLGKRVWSCCFLESLFRAAFCLLRIKRIPGTNLFHYSWEDRSSRAPARFQPHQCCNLHAIRILLARYNCSLDVIIPCQLIMSANERI